MFQSAATTFAHRLLPQPCTPSKQDAARRLEAERPRLTPTVRRGVRQPGLETVQAADLVDGEVDR